MSTSIIALVLLLAQNENYTDIRLLSPVESLPVCEAVIERIAKKDPETASRLACMPVTYESKAAQKETPTELPSKPEKASEPVSYACPPRVVLGKEIKCLDA